MFVVESPKTLAVDGTLSAWAFWLVVHGAAALVTLLTMAVLVVRLMLLVRQWRQG